MSLSPPSHDARSWSSYAFRLMSVLVWWTTAPEAMAAEVFVLYPTGQTIGSLEVELSDSLDTIKPLVQDGLGVPDGSTMPLGAT